MEALAESQDELRESFSGIELSIESQLVPICKDISNSIRSKEVKFGGVELSKTKLNLIFFFSTGK
jgi:hypothetical protein